MTPTQTCIRRPGALWTSCRCPSCMKRNARIAKRVRSGHAIVIGRDAAWARLNEWHRRQWSIQIVVDLTGVSDDTVRKAYRAIEGKAPAFLLQHATVRAILAAADHPTGHGFVPADGSVRRLRALSVMGWSMDEIASRYDGVDQSTLATIRTGRLRTVRGRNAAAVIRAYDDLAMTPGPCRLAATRARGRGWLGPLAWDDETIDDPTAQPYTDARPSSSQRPAAEVAAEVDDLLGLDPHATANDLAVRLGYSDRSGVQNALDRAGRRDLLDVLARNASLADYRTA